MGVIVRLLFTAALVFMVYGETGPFTALSIGLMAINAELMIVLIKRVQKT